MAAMLFWPGKYYFYPIGNTSAVSLTRDLPPEITADILLLGCGDPRNVLYTIYSESSTIHRKLDFTCCDYDPGVLARNMLLLTMIIDAIPSAQIWNIFYHMYLDERSQTTLVSQSRKLFEFARDVRSWESSPYSTVLRVSSEYTLAEMRRHWGLYSAFPNLDRERMQGLQARFKEHRSAVVRDHTQPIYFNLSRSAGPLSSASHNLFSQHFRMYWEGGTTFTTHRERSSAKFLNPTFLFSKAVVDVTHGECVPHYGTDPVVCFHTAALFGNASTPVTLDQLSDALHVQFDAWCDAFRAAASRPESPSLLVVRFLLADSNAACRVLSACGNSRVMRCGDQVTPWNAEPLVLLRSEYIDGGAPSTFDVIDTSNLCDHIGLFNVVISASPLLSRTSAHSVLYTEALLTQSLDPSTEFLKNLYVDIPALSIILDIFPVDYHSGFTSRSNTHELMIEMSQPEAQQFHQIRPLSPLVFDEDALVFFLFRIYHRMFDYEDPAAFMSVNRGNIQRAFRHSALLFVTQESFVLFLKIVKSRVQVSPSDWSRTIYRLHTSIVNDPTLPIASFNRSEFFTQMQRHGVFTKPGFDTPLTTRTDWNRHWTVVPPLIRILLLVPLDKFMVLHRASTSVTTPPLNCVMTSPRGEAGFCSVNAAFGRITRTGSREAPAVRVVEDKGGIHGSAPLIVSFVVQSAVLADYHPEQVKFRLSVRTTTPTAVFLGPVLGPDLKIFSAPLMDREHVFIIPEPSSPGQNTPPPIASVQSTSQDDQFRLDIGTQTATNVNLEDPDGTVKSFMTTLSVVDPMAKTAFSEKAMPTMEHIAPCTMLLTLGGRSQHVTFPAPIEGSECRLRLSRISSYIEVIVPFISPPSKGDSRGLNSFSVIRARDSVFPWNLHRINLERMHPITSPTPYTTHLKWLNLHLNMQFSMSERVARARGAPGMLTSIKDTIYAIYVRNTALDGGDAACRVFLLRTPTLETDTLIFVKDLRYDLPAHTVVCNAYVLTASPEVLHALRAPDLASYMANRRTGNIVLADGEGRVWKQLLPALAERCRMSWVHSVNCEYQAQRRIPLATEFGADPLCSCGRGKDVQEIQGMPVDYWPTIAPFLTRIAISPLFVVSYLERVVLSKSESEELRSSALGEACATCGQTEPGSLKRCARCHQRAYCSQDCQKRDWANHKQICVPR